VRDIEFVRELLERDFARDVVVALPIRLGDRLLLGLGQRRRRLEFLILSGLDHASHVDPNAAVLDG